MQARWCKVKLQHALQHAPAGHALQSLGLGATAAEAPRQREPGRAESGAGRRRTCSVGARGVWREVGERVHPGGWCHIPFSMRVPGSASD